MNRSILIYIIFFVFYTCSSPQERLSADQRIESADEVANDPKVPDSTKARVYRKVAVQNGEDAVNAGKERDECKAELESNQWKIDLVNYVIAGLIIALLTFLTYVGLKIYIRFFKPFP
jgi:hypothetical protein